MTVTVGRIAAIGLVVLGSVGAAEAGGKRFTTPLLGTAATNEAFVCSVINVDKKPVTADVKLVARNGSLITIGASDCESPIQPGTGCRVAGPTGATTGYCDVVSSSAKVRVDLLVTDLTNPNRITAAVAGTQK